MRAAPLAVAALLSACAADSVPIRYGTDTCAHCRMVIADPRFGAELVSAKGKAHTFDAIECLAAYLDDHPADGGTVLWVTDYEHPPRFLHAQTAVFLHSAQVRSPMGANLAAFHPGSNRTALVRRYGGEALAWREVRRLVRSQAPGPAGMPMGGGSHPGMSMPGAPAGSAGAMPSGMPMPGHGPGGAAVPAPVGGHGMHDSAQAGAPDRAGHGRTPKP